MKILSKIALISIFIASPALAGNTGKMYIAGDMGSVTYSNLSTLNNSGVFRVALGSRFSPNLAVEVGYSGFSDSTITGSGGFTMVSASAYQVAAIGSLPINRQSDLIGKLGLSFNRAEKSNASGASSNVSNNSLLFGVGMQFHMDPKLSVRVQYEDYGDFENAPNPMRAVAISIGLIYNL